MTKQVAGTTYHYPHQNYITSHPSAGSGQATETVYIYANGSRVATLEDGTITWNHTDHLNSSSVTTDDTGSVLQTLDYYPYGDERLNEGAHQSQRTFTDHLSDTETDLIYMNARYYDDTSRKFLSQDSVYLSIGVANTKEAHASLQKLISDPQSLNSYAYARNNPMLYIDPDGNFISLPWIANNENVQMAAMDLDKNNPVWSMAMEHPYKASVAVGLAGGLSAMAAASALPALANSVINVPGAGQTLVVNRLIEGGVYSYLAVDTLSSVPEWIEITTAVEPGNPQSYSTFAKNIVWEFGPMAFGDTVEAVADVAKLMDSLVENAFEQLSQEVENTLKTEVN